MKFTLNKKLIVTGVAALAAVAVGAGLAFYFINRPIHRADVNLTPEQRQAAQRQLAEADDAIKSFSKDAAPGDKVEPYFARGRALYALGEYADARKNLKQAIKFDTGRRDIWFTKFQVERDMRDIKIAEQSIKAALFINDQVPEYWVAYLDFKRFNLETPYEEMDKIYTEALFKSQFDNRVLASYATFLEEHKNLNGALNYYRQALEKDPGNQSYQDQISRLEKQI